LWGSGTRYLQAPLCTPKERRARLRSIAALAAGSQEAHDLRSAADATSVAGVSADSPGWLPLLVYSPTGSAPRDAPPTNGAAAVAPPVRKWTAPSAGDGAQGSDGPGGGDGDRLAATSAPRVEQRREGEAAAASGGGELGAGELGSGGVEAGAGGGSGDGDGPRRLRHGVMCPPLSALWSDYYQTHDRDPSDVRLAPWVSRVYERRVRLLEGGAAE
jgi:hypothetical protein